MIVNGSNLLQESINEYLILETRQILIENIIKNPKQYFIINEDYKKYCTKEDWEILEENVWDAIKGVTSSIGEWFKENPRQGIQTIADVVSIFDPTGIVDLVNGIFYYYFKDYFSAFFSFIGAALVMPGFLLSLTGAGAVAGVPLEVAGKSVETTKVAINTGKVSSAGVKELGTAVEVAKPFIGKIASLLEKLPISGKTMAKWLAKSSDDVVEVAAKKGAKISDISKTLNSTSTSISKNPVVKGFTDNVIGFVKKRGLQTGFAGLGIYGVYLQADDYKLKKIATEELMQAAANQGIAFDPNDEEDQDLLQTQIELHKKKIKDCKAGEDCRSIIEKNPIIASVLGGLGAFGQKGGEVLKSFDPRQESTT